MLQSRYTADRLHDIVLGLAPARKNLIRTKKWGNLLDVSKFSAPEGLLEWIIDRIDPNLGEFRNPRNNTSILFTPEMVEKVLGLPHGTRPVVVISKHEESPHREFYKTDYDHGRRAPIHYAATILEKEADLDDETFFRTFFLVALATHLTPGTGNMVPLEYLGSLEVASEELPAFLLQIIERHKAKWAQDISKATSRLSKLHAKRMEEFAQDVLAATKDNAPDPTNYSSPHRLYFAIPHKQHWILCCINLLYKQINIFDSDKNLKNDEVYELSNKLVTNFMTLAAHAKAFTKFDFMKFTCFNPPDCPQQKTHYDCGIFTMLFIKQWDGKNMANFSKDTYDHRAIITELIITSQLNNQDPTWVLNTN
ncbi:hypothetical protein D1007_45719 [Hordeum vulgare]|nr:hypothetical protein D1007_45719 [Hordeum vulgare]